jgi:hypothetical protein
MISQGALDGFCGLYATTHLTATLANVDYAKGTEELFFELLKALERRSRLTANRIASTNSDQIGFSCSMIATAFNDVPRTRRYGFAAFPFTKPRFARSKYFKSAKLVFSDGCGLVIKVDAGCHWVATKSFAEDGKYECFDPSSDRDCDKFGKIFWDEGLIIGPTELIENI